jgi:nucleotide-binding universal stress UspA family protein
VVASRLRDSDNLVGLSAPAAGFLLESKTPVIVLPAADKSWQLPKSVLIAWDNSSTAAKATRQALPLLRMAERVLILTIETSSVESKNDEQNTDIAAYLTRHDVIVERKTVHHNNDDESAILMSEIKDAGCNLLVMGAYGHTRFREMIVGGMTRNILRQMPVPVFMAH